MNRILLAVAASVPLLAQNYSFVLRPFAGTTLIGNGGPATQALLFYPYSVAVDPASGAIAVLDTFNYQLRRVAPNGTISAVAALDRPCNDVKIARDGNYFVACPGLILRVTPQGQVSIVAGSGAIGRSEDGPRATALPLTERLNGLAIDSAGLVYFTDENRVRLITASGGLRTVAGTIAAGFNGDNRPAEGAQLRNPGGLALDREGNLFIAEANRIRRIAAAGGTITTVAGNGATPGAGSVGTAGGGALDTPIATTAVAVDDNGNIFFTDSNGGSIYRVSSTRSLTRVAGSATANPADAPGTGTSLASPYGMAVDSAGRVYFAEITSHRVRVLDGPNVRTVAGRIRFGGDDGPAPNAVLNTPIDVAVDGGGSVLIADQLGLRIRKVGIDNVITTLTGTGARSFPSGVNPAAGTAIPLPTAIAADNRGNVYFGASVLVYRIAPNGSLSIFAGTGVPGNTGDGGPAVAATFFNISGLAADAAGNVYIADDRANRVRKVAPNGIVSAFAGTATAGFAGDNGPATEARLSGFVRMPLAVDNRNNVYIADNGNRRIRMVSAAGVITTVAGSGATGNPTDGAPALATPAGGPILGLAVGGNSVLYYVNDGRAIQSLDGGVIRTVRAFDPSPAADPLAISGGSGVWGIATDANFDLFAADVAASVVRKFVWNSPRAMRATGGNNQTGDVGAALPVRLEVQLDGRGGIPCSGAPVTFTVTSGSATLGDPSATSGLSGSASTSVTPRAPGTITIVAGAPGVQSVTFTITATGSALTVAPESLSFAWTEGDAAPEAQLLSVQSAEFSAAAAVEGDIGWLVVEPVEGGLQVSVTSLDQLASGTYRGTVNISGANSSKAVPVELTVQRAVAGRTGRGK